MKKKMKGMTNDDIFAIMATIFLCMAIENLGKLIHLYNLCKGTFQNEKCTYFLFKICVIEIFKNKNGYGTTTLYGGELNVVGHRFQNFTPNIKLKGGGIGNIRFYKRLTTLVKLYRNSNVLGE
jgi:hypothetical protein